VPDADDTSGALLALASLKGDGVAQRARAGLRWLLGLQNSDGGWPTFCRGWGRLPFDRSAPDLTAHALRALMAWPCVGMDFSEPVRRGLDYLSRTQREDGAWLPLWFGNQQSPEQQNPVYGTARVLAAYGAAGLREEAQAMRGLGYLLKAQNANGGWGGAAGVPSSIEETALALSALAECGHPEAESALNKGAAHLAARVEEGRLDRPTPIGLYFAKLWYSEKLYPTIWTVAALGKTVTG
jgi:squalene-hopene/tetraprenyl-beta-curcumene cyclase